MNDHQDQIPDVHRSNWSIEELPDSLTAAMMAFILACAARAARGQEGQHNSMLVHVTRFVDVQNQVADLVRFELRDLQNRIRYGDGDSPNPIVEQMHGMWKGDFVPSSRVAQELYPDLMRGCSEVSWEAVQSKLVKSSQRIQVKVINGSAKDALDYWDHPEGLSVIAIGGDKLSTWSDTGGPVRKLLPPRLSDVRHATSRWGDGSATAPATSISADCTRPRNFGTSTATSQWLPMSSGRSST